MYVRKVVGTHEQHGRNSVIGSEERLADCATLPHVIPPPRREEEKALNDLAIKKETKGLMRIRHA